MVGMNTGIFLLHVLFMLLAYFSCHVFRDANPPAFGAIFQLLHYDSTFLGGMSIFPLCTTCRHTIIIIIYYALMAAHAGDLIEIGKHLMDLKQTCTHTINRRSLVCNEARDWLALQM